MRISDWSSDVCSSDLLDESGACGDRRFSDPGRGQCGRIYAAEGGGGFGRAPPPDIAEAATGRAHGFALDAARPPQRSEERRVGKEGVTTGRSRWSPYPLTKHTNPNTHRTKKNN